MRHRTGPPGGIDVQVVADDDLLAQAEYARATLEDLVRDSAHPVLHARVRLSRHRDPAVRRPVVAQANLDVDGRPVRAQVHADTAREAVDLLRARVRRQLERVADRRRERRGDAAAPGWRHGAEARQRPAYFPRPAENRRVLRRKSFTMAPCTVDAAAREMELLDYDFHLFTEKGSGCAAVLYRSGPTGYRLSLVAPSLADRITEHELPLTISRQPVPCLTLEDAVDRLGLLDLPFLFFIDAAHGCASIVYRRYDGHYAWLTPAA